MLTNKKRGAEESNVIIFIILALIVAGLVVYFSWKFFGTGVSTIDASDPTVTVAVESCRLEIQRQESSYCNSEKYIKLKSGGEMSVSCYYLDNFVKKSTVSEGLDIKDKECRNQEEFKKNICERIKNTMSERDANSYIVNGEKCSNILKGE